MKKSIVSIVVFVVVFIGCSFLPVIVVRKGNEVMGHLPWYIIYGAPLANWLYVLIHLLMSAVAAGLCVFVGRRISKLKQEP